MFVAGPLRRSLSRKSKRLMTISINITPGNRSTSKVDQSVSN